MSATSPAYRYPDPGDAISKVGMDGSGLRPSQWEEQESAVLGLFIERLLPRRRRHLLDYGSGDGRLLPRISDHFDSATAFEPDPTRRADQVARLATDGRLRHVRTVASFEPAEYVAACDAALCSHVLEHVATDQVEAILAELGTVLRPGAPLLLLTTLTGWHGQRIRFATDRLCADGSMVEHELTMDEFDAACRNNRQGELPIRFFDVEEIEGMLARHGFATVFTCGYHGPRGTVGPLVPGSAPLPDLLYECRDIAVAAVRLDER